MNNYFVQFVFKLLLVLILANSALAQKNDKNVPAKIEPRPCEFNNLVLERANREAGQDSLIILIARLGKKDTQKEISSKRLYTTWAYLTKYSNLRKSESIITAEAARDNKQYYGGIEIYVNGKLFDVLTAKANGLIGLGSCDYTDSDDGESRAKRALLYPWLYKSLLKKK